LELFKNILKRKNNLYKLSISILFGIIGFLINFLDFQIFTTSNFKISILLGLLFPLIIAHAWGLKWGAISALFGGTQTMWFLWQNDGWGILYSVPVFTLWILWHGYWADKRKTNDKNILYSPFFVEIPFRIVIESGFYVIFPLLVSLNPPFWNQSTTINEVSIEWINTVVIKHLIIGYLLLIIIHILLSLNYVRKFFKLKKIYTSKIRSKIYLIGIVSGVISWFLMSFFDYLLFHKEEISFIELILLKPDEHMIFLRNFSIMGFLIASLIVAHYVSKKLIIQKKLNRTNSLLKAISSVNQIIVKGINIKSVMNKICDSLLETKAFKGIEIALKDNNTDIIKKIASSGEPVFEESWFIDTKGNGNVPNCIYQAVEKKDIQIINPKKCGQCSYKKNNNYRLILTPITRHNNLVGLLLIRIDANYKVGIKEKKLLKEVANDLSFTREKLKFDKERERLIHELGERVKELQCLENLTNSIENRENLQEIFYDLVNFIPQGWNYPSITRAKVIFDGMEYKVENFEESKWSLSSDIIINGNKRGKIEVYYIEEKSQKDEGPFFKEERRLLDNLSKNLSNAIERQEAKNKLIKAKNDWENIFQATGQPTTIIDKDFNILNANKSVLEKTGMSLEELKKKKCHEVFHGTDEPPENCPMKKLLETNNPEMSDMPIEILKGHYLVSVTPVFDENKNLEKVIHIAVDITERKEAQKNLEQTIEKAPFPIMLQTGDGEVLKINKVWSDITGYTQEEIPTIDEWTKKAYGKKAEKIKEFILNLHNNEGITDEGEFTITTKNGEKRVWNFHSAKIGETPNGKNLMVSMANDITERKNIEDQLIKSKKRYKNLFYENPVGILYYNKDGVIVDCNEKFVDIIGSSKEVLCGLNMLKSLKDKKLIQEVRKSLKIGEGHYEDIYNSITADKKTPVRIIFKGIRNEKNEIYAGIGLVEDVTERKKAEKRLKKSEKLLKQTEKLAKIGGWEYDIKTDKMIWSNQIYNIYNVNKNSFHQNKIDNVIKFYLKEDRKKIKQAFNKSINEGKNYDLEVKFKPKNKEVIWIRTIGKSVKKNGEIIKVIGNMMNIDERKRLEDKLKENEQKFRRIYEHMTVGIAHVSLNFKIIDTNDAYLEMLGYSEKEIIGKHLKDITHPENLEKNLEKQRKLKKGEIEHFRMEKKFIHKDGHTVYGILDANLVRGADNNPSYFLGSVVDITEMKKAEKEKEKLQKQLLQSQKLESIGTLAGGVAHDFNNILTVIKGTSDLLLNKIDKSNKNYDEIKNIYESSERAEKLTNQLLLFSRKQDMKFSRVNINKVINNMMNLLRRLLSENIEIKTQLTDSINMINADKNQIEEVLINLSVNAQDSMPEGGKLFIKTDNISIDSKMAKTIPNIVKGKYIRIDVEDTGHGIKPEIIDKIFDPFFTTKGLSKGTGMGLSVVLGIIKKHDGFINVYSEINHGTVFKIYLPIDESNDEKEKNRKENKKTNNRQNDFDILMGKKETILIIEDEQSVLDLVENVLTNYNYEFLSAESGKKGHKIFKEKKDEIDLLISDIVLTDENGIDLANKMKKEKSDLKVILTSGYSNDEYLHSEIDEKGYEFIQKPFHIKDLVKLIKKTISQ